MMKNSKVSIPNNPQQFDDSQSLFIAGDFAPPTLSSNIEPADFFSTKIRDIIEDSEASILNYEGVTAEEHDQISKGGPTVEIHKNCPELLTKSGIDAVTLANNHTVDFGVDGLTQTIEACQDGGLQVFGAGKTIHEAVEPARWTIKGQKISIFNFSERPLHSYYIEDKKASIADITHPELIKKISKEREQADVVIGIAHAGEIGIPIPPVQLQQRYRRFIDIGVDIIVGHHPHVPQGWEEYNNGTIFYSVGDFLFELEGYNPPEQQWGLTVQIWINTEGVRRIDILPVEVVNGKVYLLGRNRDREKHIQRLYQMVKVLGEQKRLKLMWLTIADELFSDRETGYNAKSPETFLTRMVWDSHRYTTETALIKRTMKKDIPAQIIKDTTKMWQWTDSDPYNSDRARKLEKVTASLYSGPIKSLSKKIGVHTHFRKCFDYLTNIINRL